jgi:hypothetical protein
MQKRHQREAKRKASKKRTRISGDCRKRQWAAHNETVPVEILEILSRDPDAKTRSWVAMERKLPEDIQLRLAEGREYSVRYEMAHNAKATEAVLKLLAAD